MILAVDIGATSAKLGIFDENVKLFDHYSIFYEHSDFDYRYNAITNKIESELNKHSISSIGIGFPGAINQNRDILSCPNMPNWTGKNLYKLFNFERINTYIDNDAKIACYSEIHSGIGINVDNFLFVTLGTGIGGAIVLNKKIFRGNHFAAGEIGYTIINYDDTNSDIVTNRIGIMEEYAAQSGIIQTAKQHGLNISNIKELDDFIKDGNVNAILAIKESAQSLAAGLSSIMNILDINHVVLAGGISNIDDLYFDTINTFITKRSLPHIANSFQIIKSKYGSQAGICGAAFAAKYEI